MDSSTVSSALSGLMIAIGVASIIIGIVKVIQAKKQELGKGYKIKTICISAFMAIVMFFFASLVNQEESNRGQYALENHPYSIKEITYGQAINSTCEDVDWSGTNFDKSEDGNTFLQLDGTCNYKGKKKKIKIQFDYGSKDIATLDKSTPFEISFIGLGGKNETSNEEMKDILYYMFEQYAKKHKITIDESMKNGILSPEAPSDEEEVEESGTEKNETEEGSQFLNAVKEGYPEAYNGITYGDAFTNFFDKPKWEYFLSEDDKNIVEFTGICQYDGEDMKVCMQFEVKKKTFDCMYLEYDGEVQDKSEINNILDTVFTTYVEDSKSEDKK